MTLTAQWLAAALRASDIETEGVNLFLADGEAVGQEVMHAHLHVIPRRRGDGFRLHASRGATPTRSQLDDQATAIRAATVG